MKTLADYIAGYGIHPMEILLLTSFRHKNDRYYLCKKPNLSLYFFMKGEEVLKVEDIPGDAFPELSVQIINHPKDQKIKELIYECKSYKLFKEFIKEQTNENFEI